MATYVKKSDGWAARIRVRGRPEVYETGFRTKQDAKDWAGERETELRNSPKMKGKGPRHTTLAEALTDYVKAVNRQVDEVVSVMHSTSAPSLGHRMKMAAEQPSMDDKPESPSATPSAQPRFEVINLMAAKAQRARQQHGDAEPAVAKG